jgi:predicted amidohydrolase
MDPLKLAVVQFNPQLRKVDDNLACITDLTEDLDVDIIVLPELSTSGYFFISRNEVAKIAEPADGRTGKFFKDMARRLQAIVVAGFAESSDDKLFNSCLLALPEKDELHIYRKTHLFYKEADCFDVGDTGFFVVEDPHRDVRIGPMICYDWRFPEASRILTLLGADLIVCPSDLVTDVWRVAMPGRAVENKVYIAVANRTGTEKRRDETLTFTGKSAIYGFNGKELASAGPDENTVIQAEINPSQTRDKSFNPFNDILGDRQPQFYSRLTEKR